MLFFAIYYLYNTDNGYGNKTVQINVVLSKKK